MLRLQSPTDFKRVRREGRSHAHPLVILVACRRPAAPSDAQAAGPVEARCGFAASAAIGKAVRRNRAKRLLREAVRKRAPNLAPGWDLIFIARAPIGRATLAEVQEAVDSLVRRARLWEQHD